MTTITRSNHALAILLMIGCMLTLASGCGKESSVQVSKPAQRDNGKASDTPATPLAGVTTQPSRTATPTTAPEDSDRVEMGGGRATAVAPTTAPAAPGAPQHLPRVQTAKASENQEVASFAGLTGPKPATWQFRQPDPTKIMRVAEYAVPGVDGAGQADIIVFQFPGGGSVEGNIDRWKTQVRNADGSPAEPKIETFEADGLKVTVAELAGEYRGMGSASAQPDHILIASMIETEGNPVFVQLVGPSKTVNANREAFLNLLRGIKQTDPMK